MLKTDLVAYLQRHVLKLEPDGAIESPRSGPGSGKSAESTAAVPFSVAHHPVLPPRVQRVQLTK